MAPTNWVPKMSARYAGMVENPPPYIVRMTKKMATNTAGLASLPANGTSA